MSKSKYEVERSEEAWQELLGPEAYRILRQKGTEYPHTGLYNLHFEEGSYHCKGCGATLFTSEQKFESGCGWPSFDASEQGAIEYRQDRSHGMVRTEILCARCGGHLGHVFDDGPTATGIRYCVNSLSLDFKNQEQ